MTDSVTDVMIQAAISDGMAPGISKGCVRDVVATHDQRGWNYVWLQPHLGLPLWVDFSEKSMGEGYHTYNKFFWARHGSVVSHDPDKLVKEHVKFFVGPNAPIKLLFYFQTPMGFVYSASPEAWWYELEAAFFRRHGLCSKHQHRPTATQVAKYMQEATNEGLAPHWGPEVLKRPVLEPPPLKIHLQRQRQRQLDKGSSKSSSTKRISKH